MKKIALEKTTNTHNLEASAIEIIDEKGSTVTLKIKGDGLVTHGEHGTIVTESENIIKYVQKEINPINQKIEDAND